MINNTLFFQVIVYINILGSFTSLLIYLWILYRIDKIASNKVDKKDFSLIFKIILVCIFILIDVIQISLSIVYNQFWLSDKLELEISQVLPIFDMLLQFYIMTRQHKKQIKQSIWHNVYRIFLITINCLIIVYILINQLRLIYLSFPLSKIILLLVLVIYSVAVQPFKFQQEFQLPKELSLLQKQLYHSGISHLENSLQLTHSRFDKIYIEFHKEIKLLLVKTIAKYQFKIAVYTAHRSYVIHRNEEDIKNLHNEMKKINHQIQDFLDVDLDNTNLNLSYLNQGERKCQIYEQYLLKLTKSPQYYYRPLLEFLQLDEKSMNSYLKLSHKRMSTISYMPLDFELTESNKFFKVKYINNQIKISNPDILELNIERNQKHFKELQEIHEKLLQEGKIKNKFLNKKTEKQFLQFVDYIVNTKNCWMDFSRWLDLGRKTQIAIYNLYDDWYNGFSKMKINVLGHELSVDADGHTFTIYLFNLLRVKNENETKYILKKRFSDFLKLEKQLKKCFALNKQIKLPGLPPKISPFGSKTSAKSRQIYLQTYLLELIQIKQINHCIKFLQFLQNDNDQQQNLVLYRSDDTKMKRSEKITMDQIKLAQEQSYKIQGLVINTIL